MNSTESKDTSSEDRFEEVSKRMCEKRDVGGPQGEANSQTFRWKMSLGFGLLAALAAVACLFQEDDQCSSCEGEGVSAIELHMPMLSEEKLGDSTWSCQRCGGAGRFLEGALYGGIWSPPMIRCDQKELYSRASGGDAEAQFMLGLAIKRGGKGYPFKEPAEASPMYWMEKAAEQGLADAQYFYARPAKTVGMLQKFVDSLLQAANQGHVMAQDRLAYLYHSGTGVSTNAEECFRWCTLASESEQDLAMAHWRLGALYDSGFGVQKDYERAVGLYRRAADAGLGLAMRSLSYNFESGEGVPVDLAKAYVWRVMGNTFDFVEGGFWLEEKEEGLRKLVSKMDAADKAAAQELFLEVWERLRFISHNHDDFGDPLPANYPGVASTLLKADFHESD
jgi:tetratricopeptide (TPR) repeat protein